MKHEIKPKATFNDIVLVAGYGNNLFAVEAYYYEYYYEPDAELTELVYDLTCVYGDSGYIIADQSDVSLACKAEKADVFLQAYKPKTTFEVKLPPSLMAQLNRTIGNGGEEMTKQPTKVAKEKVPTKQEQIDALLDERIVVENVVDTVGWIIENEDGYKQRRLDEIDAKLKELTAE